MKALVRRHLESRYKGSVIGNLWSLLNQLSQLLIYTYVFSIVLKVKLSINGLPENNITFGLWLFAGLLPWIAFTGGVTQAANSVVEQPSLVKKVVFPLGLLPLVPLLSTFIESAFGLMALYTRSKCESLVLHDADRVSGVGYSRRIALLGVVAEYRGGDARSATIRVSPRYIGIWY